LRLRRSVRIAAWLAAAVFAAVAVVYLVVQCRHIPAPLPGREPDSAGHRYGFAAAAFAVAAILLAGGSFPGRRRAASS
jgi:hypothetical protein